MLLLSNLFLIPPLQGDFLYGIRLLEYGCWLINPWSLLEGWKAAEVLEKDKVSMFQELVAYRTRPVFFLFHVTESDLLSYKESRAVEEHINCLQMV